MLQNNERLRMFTASRISDLLAGGAGKSKLNYIFDIASEAVGAKVEISTKQMEHGKINERTAVDILCSIYGGSPNISTDGSQTFYKVNDKLGATPDAIGMDWSGDAKCQYTIHNFISANDVLPKKHLCQVQAQMMSLKVDTGFLINYLTKPEEWGEELWEEYPFPVKDRYHVHEIKTDKQIQYEILQAVELYYPFIGLCEQMIGAANMIDAVTFFGMQMYEGKRFLKLKDTNWPTNEREVLRYENSFYVIK